MFCGCRLSLLYSLLCFFFCLKKSYSMSQKRQQEEQHGKVESESKSPQVKRSKVPSLKSVILEAMKVNSIQTFFSALEPLLRRVVKEEVEIALKQHLANIKPTCGKLVHPSTSRSLQLQFKSRLSLPVFTGAKVEGEDNSSIEVVLVDAFTGEVVNSGPESLSKVEIVVLEGDFEGDKEDNWTREEFQNNIVKEREGKRPLLSGDAFLNLNDGRGVVGELVFTDNSSWTRSRKFRLGARVVDDNRDGIRLREAKTEAFMVKDHRGELYKKHYPPSLSDEVWRLEKIGKDGAFHKRLSREKIDSVKDFLTLLNLDGPRLRNILGSGMSAKMWESTVEHVRTCTLGNRMHLYSPSGAQQRGGVVFNVVGEAMGLLSGGQYLPMDELPEADKEEARMLVKAAYEHWDEVISCDNESVLDGSSNMDAGSLPSQSMASESSFGSKFLVPQKPGEVAFPQSSESYSDVISSILSLGGTRSLDDYALHDIENVDFRYDQPCQVITSICQTSIAQSLHGEERLQYFDMETPIQSQDLLLGSQADLHAAVNSFIANSARKANMRWNILYSLLKWRSSIKRKVASSRRRIVREKRKDGLIVR